MKPRERRQCLRKQGDPSPNVYRKYIQKKFKNIQLWEGIGGKKCDNMTEEGECRSFSVRVWLLWRTLNKDI